MTRTEQYLDEAQSFLDKGHFTEAEKERLAVMRDIAVVKMLDELVAQGEQHSDLLDAIHQQVCK